MPNTTPNSYDFDDLMQSFVVFMQSQAEFKDYNFDGSGLREVMRLLSYDAEQRALQNQFGLSEISLATAQIRANVVQAAADLGYFSKGKQAAKITVDIVVTPKDSPAPGTLLELSKAVKFFANRDGGAVYFSPSKDYTTTLGDDGLFTFSGVVLLQGVWSYVSFLSSANDSVEAFTIPDAKIDVDTMSVQVRATETTADYDTYTKFKSAYDLGAKSKVFFVKENRDGLFDIEFGDGKVANKLSFGNVILIEYLSTDGELGNEIAALTPASGVGQYFDIQVITNGETSYGGVAAEDISVIKKAAPMSFAAQGNAVTEGDYASVVRDLFPDVKSVIAWGGENNNPPRQGYTFVSVVMKSGLPLTPQQKVDIKEALEQYNVGSIDVIVVDPEYIYLVVDTLVEYKTIDTVLAPVPFTAKIKDYTKRFSSQKLEAFGVKFDKSQLISFINVIDKSIKGNITTVQYEKRFVPTLNFLGTYTFEFERTLMPGSLMVENFTVSDVDFLDYVYFIYDANGVLKLAKRNTITQNVVGIKDIGQINYTTGKIDIIGFQPISIKGGYVSLRVRPQGDESFKATGRNIPTIQDITINLTAPNA